VKKWPSERTTGNPDTRPRNSKKTRKKTCAGKTAGNFRTTGKNQTNAPITKTEKKPNGSRLLPGKKGSRHMNTASFLKADVTLETMPEAWGIAPEVVRQFSQTSFGGSFSRITVTHRL
jgi:hypothetical protein